MVEIVVDRLQHRLGELAAKLFAFFVDVAIGPAREVDPFEGTRGNSPHIRNLLVQHLAVFTNNQRVPRFDFLYGIDRHIEGGLDGRALGSDDDKLVVLIEKSGADAAGVAHHEQIAVTDNTGHGVTPVEIFNRTL